MKAKTISCGVLVTDGERLLLGHATAVAALGHPEGIAEPGEAFAAAARRELFEETGLEAPEAALRPLGVFSYLPAKDLALFLWMPPGHARPGRAGLHLLLSSGTAANGPNSTASACSPRDEALRLVGKNMARVLAGIPLAELCGASK